MYFQLVSEPTLLILSLTTLECDLGFANLVYAFAHLYCLHTLMDCLTPPMFDVFNIDVWKIRMSAYLKALGLHVFLAATKKSYLGNSKHIEAMQKP